MITFSSNLYVLINIYFRFCFFVKTHAMMSSVGYAAPSRSYDPELAPITRLMIIYLAFLPPSPLCSHALNTSVIHSSHLFSNFLFLYLLVRPTLGPSLDYILLFWSMLACGILPSLLVFRIALSVSVLRGAICRGWRSHFSVNMGVSGASGAWITHYCCSP